MAVARLVVFCALLVSCALAEAQTTVDGFNPGVGGPVYALAVQRDGKILVGGDFETLGGGPATSQRKFIGRLNADGSRDVSFSPALEGPVYALSIQPDGKSLVGGSGLVRMNTDGSIDTSFTLAAGDIRVMAIAVQTDGKILLGGIFDSVGLIERRNIARINADGSLDRAFNPGARSVVYALALQPDGKILVGGRESGLTRLRRDGSLDTDFNPQVSLVDGTPAVHVIVVEKDGRILIGGRFENLAHTQRENIARVNADGTVDGGFNPGTNEVVVTLAVQSNGQIVLGGDFTRLGGGGAGAAFRNCIGRLNADGSPDIDFNPGANGPVHAVVPHSDGTILVGGDFTALGGGTGTTPRTRIGRIVPLP